MMDVRKTAIMKLKAQAAENRKLAGQLRDEAENILETARVEANMKLALAGQETDEAEYWEFLIAAESRKLAEQEAAR